MTRTQGAPKGRARSIGFYVATISVVCVAVVVLLTTPGGVAARARDSVPEAGSIVRCEPLSIAGLANGVVTADVYIQDVAALYGADVQLGFDASIVQVLDENPNASGIQVMPLASFLKPEFVILNAADNVAGTIRYAVTQLNPTSPVTGSGSLLRFRLQPLRSGTFTMQFTRHDLADRSGRAIPNTAVSCAVTISDSTRVLYLPLIMR